MPNRDGKEVVLWCEEQFRTNMTSSVSLNPLLLNRILAKLGKSSMCLQVGTLNCIEVSWFSCRVRTEMKRHRGLRSWRFRAVFLKFQGELVLAKFQRLITFASVLSPLYTSRRFSHGGSKPTQKANFGKYLSSGKSSECLEGISTWFCLV